MSDYKSKVGELRSENDYQLRLKDMNYGDKIKEMKDSHGQEMDSLRAQYEVRLTTHHGASQYRDTDLAQWIE